jgi:hypothetical protein
VVKCHVSNGGHNALDRSILLTLIASIGAFALPHWMLVYSLADVKPGAFGKLFAVLN